MKTLYLKVSQPISLEHFEEIIVSALEGGSNYWYHIKDIPTFIDKTKTLSENIADVLYHDPGFQLDIYDYESEDDLLGTITQKSLIEALEICYRDYSNHFHDLMEGQSDAETADLIFQLAVMGDVVFG